MGSILSLFLQISIQCDYTAAGNMTEI